MRFCFVFLLFLSQVFSAEILLFSVFDESKFSDEDIKKYVMSEKFDGVRGLWDGQVLRTRNAHIINAPADFTRNFPNFTLDGELFIARGKFDEMSALIRAKNDDKLWQSVVYKVFDAPNACVDFKLNPCTLQTRLKALSDFLKAQALPTKIELVKQIEIASKAHLKGFYEDVLGKGGEGVIIRKNELEYEKTRFKFAFKLKPFFDAECEVVGYTQGKGRLENKVGALLCKNLSDSKMFKIGSGLSLKERENPPKIGSIITYKFNGYTKNNLPRFPVFLRIRHNP